MQEILFLIVLIVLNVYEKVNFFKHYLLFVDIEYSQKTFWGWWR